MTESSSVEKELRSGRFVVVNTRGVSMQPLLQQGKTQVQICPMDRPPEVGDLLLEKIRPGLYRLHRVVRMDGTGIYTRGDNCYTMEKVKEDQILGLVTEIYRGEKQIPMDGRGYGLYCRVWQITAPLRLLLYRLRDRSRGLLKRVMGRG